MDIACNDRKEGGLTANTIKWIAIFAMLLDHTADAFILPGSWSYIVMRGIGRITGPVMFYMVAVGYRHTRNKNRYTLRLAAFAAVSYVPYIYFVTGAMPQTGSFLKLNVIYTIWIGLLAIRAQHEIKPLPLRVPVLCALMLLSVMGDWGLTGFLIMLAFDLFYGDTPRQLFVFLLLAGSEGGLFQVLLYPFVTYLNTGSADFGIYPLTFYRLGFLLPMVLIWLYNGQKGRGGFFAKWAFYVIYPLHLLVLGLLRHSVMAL